NRHTLRWSGLPAVGLGLTLLVGCDYSPPDSFQGTGGTLKPGFISSVKPSRGSSPVKVASTPRTPEERKAILESSITLIQRAALQPGGDNFRLAVQKLNQYFEGTDANKYLLKSAGRDYLKTQLPEGLLRELENQEWSLRDARHLEDCMMYYGIATRV